jgi:hypothetical protein
MIELSGHVITKDNAPYIYLIRKGPYIFIGETQRNPVLIWGEHLLENGSFLNALRRRNEDFFSENVETEFYAYRCCRIETEVRAVEKRRVTQAIEHQLHVRFICNGADLISDTTRTAPTDCRYQWVREVVDQIYREFSKAIFAKA